MPWPATIKRPLETILALGELRDLTAHSKPEKLSVDVIHDEWIEPPLPVSDFRSKFTLKDKVETAVHDVEEFVSQLHSRVAGKVKASWFGNEALRGPYEYSSGETTLGQ